MAFKVVIDDNFHYMDPERNCAGEFESAERGCSLVLSVRTFGIPP